MTMGEMVEPSIQVGHLKILADCDLVAVLHREPRMSDATKTFAGVFDDRPYWTKLTPDNARRLASALVHFADYLDRLANHSTRS